MNGPRLPDPIPIPMLREEIGEDRWLRVLAEKRREELANLPPSYVRAGFEFRLLMHKSQVTLQRALGGSDA